MTDRFERCWQCHTPIADGETFYRYMVAQHHNGNRWWVSRKRVMDLRVCAACHIAAANALARRANLYDS